MVDASTFFSATGVSVGRLVEVISSVETGEVVETGRVVGTGVGAAGFTVQAARAITLRRMISRIMGLIFMCPDMDVSVRALLDTTLF
jgi:glutamate-1-semialdehyde aminotransferase